MMTLTSYGRPQWLTIIVGSLVLAALPVVFNVHLWWISLIVIVIMFSLLSFFRDPKREVPAQRGVMISPADGKVSSVHEVEHFEPFGEGALCVRVFMSVLNVHVNRSPCYARVASITPKAGEFISALNPKSAEVNASSMMLLLHPTKSQPIAAVRQVAGQLARNIVNAAKPGDLLQRGQKYGMIKFGSTAELYIPKSLQPRAAVGVGQFVQGGLTILAQINPLTEPRDGDRKEVVAEVDEPQEQMAGA